MKNDPTAIAPTDRRLTTASFQRLSEMPLELEWLANIDNPKTQKAYQVDVREFMAFVGIDKPNEMGFVTRAHVIAWRDVVKARGVSDATVRRKLSALSSLFEFLCDRNAVTHNPVDGVKRPRSNSSEGATPAISAEDARKID